MMDRRYHLLLDDEELRLYKPIFNGRRQPINHKLVGKAPYVIGENPIHYQRTLQMLIQAYNVDQRILIRQRVKRRR